ncbi:MAG: methylmalonyl-CoA mutase, partial [Acidimicrobiia bacterium]|nr:methylmalonyl-CoA mutase [Acidimicrobiia bacterium]
GSMLEGVYAGIDDGYFVGEIADAAYRFEREVNAGRRIIVGVNEFTENDDDEANLLSIGHATEEMQIKRLEQVRGDRDADAVRASLAALIEVANQPDVNLMPSIIDAVRTYATEGEIVSALESVFGTYVETAVV